MVVRHSGRAWHLGSPQGERGHRAPQERRHSRSGGPQGWGYVSTGTASSHFYLDLSFVLCKVGVKSHLPRTAHTGASHRFSATRGRRMSCPTQNDISERRASCHAPSAFLSYGGRTPAQRGAAACPGLPSKVGLSGRWDSQGVVECREGRPGSCLRPRPPTAGRLGFSISRKPRLPGWSALSSGESPQRAGAGSCSSSWAWRGASAQCLLRVEPDTLWNGLRLVGDAPGAATAPAVKLHLPSACCVRPRRSREGGHKLLRACISVEEGRAEIRDVIRQQIVSRVRGWAAHPKTEVGEARDIGMKQAGRCFTDQGAHRGATSEQT